MTFDRRRFGHPSPKYKIYDQALVGRLAKPRADCQSALSGLTRPAQPWFRLPWLRRFSNGLAGQAEPAGRRAHVAVIGPHTAFSDFLRRRKMDCVGGAYEQIAGTGNIDALVLRSRASVTGMRFHKPSSMCLEKRKASSRTSLRDNAPSRMCR